MSRPRVAVDVEALGLRGVTALRAEHPGARLVDLRPLPGGASGFTYVAVADGLDGPLPQRRIVLKVAPPGLAPVGNRDVLRQARLLTALAATPVPVPEVLFTLPEEDDQPPGFAMSHVPGEGYEPNMDGPSGHPGADGLRARMAHAVEVLAALHGIEPGAIGLGAEPVIDPAAEVARWARALQTVPAEFTDGADALHDALVARIPPAWPAAVVHGDFRLGNTLAAAGRIAAVIDWEIWAVSDPRVDLAWLLMQVDRRTQPLAVWQADGMPDELHVVRDYVAALGRTVPDLDWFAAAARYKQAAISALVVKNNRRRAQPDPEIERHAANPAPSIAAGLRLLAG